MADATVTVEGKDDSRDGWSGVWKSYMGWSEREVLREVALLGVSAAQEGLAGDVTL